MIYIFIQTNRVKIKELLSSFSKQAVELEVFIAPRPLPKKTMKFYTAFSKVEEGTKNHQSLIKLKSHKIISESEFDEEISKIEYFWKRSASV
jgi:hypothetical protein